MSAEAGAEAESGPGGEGGLSAPETLPEWLSLDPGEEVHWAGQPSTVSIVSGIVWGIILLPLFGLGLLVMIGSVLSVINTDYVVTDKTLYLKKGTLSTNIESVGLDKIQNTEYRQSFLGKQFGYGSIDVSTAGSGGAEITFRAIEQPREVRELVNRLSRNVGGTTAGATGGVEGVSGTAGGAGTAGAGTAGAAGSGARAELAEDLLSELSAINESMANVERLLREERGGGSAEAAGSAESATEGDPTADTYVPSSSPQASDDSSSESDDASQESGDSSSEADDTSQESDGADEGE